MAQEFNIGAMKAEAMRKAFGIDLEKGRTGVYEDNAENRRLNRVGQPYGHKKQEEAPTGGKGGAAEATPVAKHAEGASDEALKRAAADPKAAPEVKAAAEAEMKKRGSGGEKGGKKKGVDFEVLDINSYIKKSKKQLSDIDKSIEEWKKLIDESEDDKTRDYFKRGLESLFASRRNLLSNIEYLEKENSQAVREEKQAVYEKRQEEKKKEGEENKKRLIEATKSDGLTFYRLADILNNDADTREAVCDYFNYDPDWAEENGANEEQLAFCKKLKKLGAKIAPKIFDWKEQEEAEEYERKMQDKGYVMFQVYDGDTYMWLAVKSDKLK